MCKLLAQEEEHRPQIIWWMSIHDVARRLGLSWDDTARAALEYRSLRLFDINGKATIVLA